MSIFRFRRSFTAILVIVMLLTSFTLNAPAYAAGKLKVVATISVYGDFVKNIAGDKVDLVTLVGLDGDPHEYEATPADSAQIADANLIFENGLELESWLDKMVQASGSKAKRVVVTYTINPAPAPDGELKDSGKDFDPHVWHDVVAMMDVVKVIRGTLIQADPQNAATYAANADTYLKQLTDLDTFVKQEVETLPQDRRKLVTNHDAFGYYARRYGFTVVGTLLGVSTEASDPSAADVAKLVDQIKAAKVPAIFAEASTNGALITRVAKEAGVVLGPELMADGLGKAGDTYIKMITYNTTTIVEALKK
jgi:zinc/manganese transport system substrate-binding protein